MGTVAERSPDSHAMAAHPLLTGSGRAIPLHLALPTEVSVVLAGLTLALIAGVYLGFAFADGRLSVMFTELFVALGFTGAALAGVIHWPAWTVIAIGAHGLWDWAHHHERVSTRMPRWYVPFCAVYDWIYAAGLLGIWWRAGALLTRTVASTLDDPARANGELVIENSNLFLCYLASPAAPSESHG